MNEFKTLNYLNGFSMIEVLITIIILSVGLLGISAMQLQSLRYNTDAELMSSAVYLGADMSNRIRADWNSKDSYRRSPPVFINANFLKASGVALPAGVNQELDDWGTMVSNLLPGIADDPSYWGEIYVCGTSGIDGDTTGDGIADAIAAQTQEGNDTNGNQCPDTNILGELDLSECNAPAATARMMLIHIGWPRPRVQLDNNGNQLTIPCTTYHTVLAP